MSFSSDVKKELCAIECESDCCKRAEAYGLVFFGRAFGRGDISIMTDYSFVAERYKNAIAYLIHAEPTVTTTQSGKTVVSLDKKEDRIDLLNELGYTGNETSLRILKSNIEKECCLGAFIRGAFLACGIITDPKKEYHLEFGVSFKNKGNDFCDLFEDFSASPKKSERSGVHIVYFKDSSHIEDVLTVMGAQLSVLELINEKIYKDVRNNVNRKVNCDNANIRKTCKAASLQISAINKLKATGKFDDLPPELKELAVLRLENPEMSFDELSSCLAKPISRSGINHRFKKIIEMAEIN